MKKVRIEDAIGLPICHDMTRVVPGEFKGVAFKKGHIITENDINELKKIGKEHVYVDEIPEGYIHENECAERISRAVCDKESFIFTDVAEGKVNIKANRDGLLKVNKERLFEINNIEHVTVSTKYDDIVVRRGDVVASDRIIPLYTKESNIEKVEKVCYEEGKVIEIKPFIKQKVHLVITGNEVYKGLIKDRFYDALEPKMKEYGCEIANVAKAPDDKEMIKNEIQKAYDDGAEIIICTGGMSVDEDDLTPIAIKELIDELIIHGTPVQPGNMFLLGYKGNVPIMGVPGAVMFYPYTIFDIAFPKVACKEKITKDFFINLGFGGLCHFCKECHYPNCTFLKGRR